MCETEISEGSHDALFRLESERGVVFFEHEGGHINEAAELCLGQ